MKKALIIIGIVLAVAVIGYLVYIRLRKKGVIGSGEDCCAWDSAGNCKRKKVNGECPKSDSGSGIK
jgi:hypothetical protein